MILTMILILIISVLTYINVRRKNYFILILYLAMFLPIIVKYISSYSIQFYTSFLNNRQINRICQQINYKTLKDIEGNISDECCICLDDFKRAEDVIMLPCGCFQAYHEKCIRPWLLNNFSCPSCRFRLSFF